MKAVNISFQEVIRRLDAFWSKNGCLLGTPYGVELGAGTGNPYTIFWSLGKRKVSVAYLEPCRRPADGRYGENPNRMGHYFQYQVMLKPAPENNQKLFLQSLEELGIKIKEHDIRFVEDNWEAPSIGASGLGWEVWCDGMEIAQYTYFQKMATLELPIVPVEITYGLERIAMYLQGVPAIVDILWDKEMTYGEIYRERERQHSIYNFEESGKEDLKEMYTIAAREAKRCLEKKLYYPAYDYLLKMSHLFNLMDARKMITDTQRVESLGKMRECVKEIALLYLENHER